MSSNNVNDQVFKEKRKPKGEIKYGVQLNEEQKLAKGEIYRNTITIVKGQAGSGKTLLLANVALDMLYKRDVEKVIMIRPAVTAGENIGYLPGSLEDKLTPFTTPITENMIKLDKKEKIESLLQEGRIEILPVAFARGRNFSDAFIIIDEAQNVTHLQMQLLLGRLCKGSKLAICGDNSQIDLRDKKDSGFDFLIKHMKGVEGFGFVDLKTNHRHEIVEDILKIYKEFGS